MSTSALLDKPEVKQLASELAVLLSDTYLLYIKSQNFHWNVCDPRFHSLHEFFEQQYEELADAVDLIAERIRALGARSPGSMQEFLAQTRLEESVGTALKADAMLKALLNDHESIISWLRKAIDFTAELGDQGSSDLCVQRLRAHEKSAWMIRSHLRETV